MEGDRAWLEADGAALSSVLQLFEQCGVEVWLDPSLERGRISGEWENTPVDRLVAQLARPHSYVLGWKRIESPLGALDQIASIRIFSDGHASAAQPLSPKSKVLDVIKGADGTHYIRGEIMVGFSEGSTIDNLKSLLEKINGTVIEVINPPGIYRIKLSKGLSVEEALARVKALPNVKAAEPNLAFPRLGNTALPALGSGVGINLNLQPGETAVAVFDSGLDPQYASLPFIRGTYDAVDPSAEISDSLGHGTLTSLIAAGAITPLGAEAATTGVPVLSIRTFDENGMTSSDTLMRALEYAANSGAKIISMSWGSDVDSAFMEQTMNFAAQNGITLYAAAGNEPTGIPIFPAGYDSVIAVGGLNPDGTPWEQSNYGDFVEAYGPAKAEFEGKAYAGTSIATPYEAFLDALRK